MLEFYFFIKMDTDFTHVQHAFRFCEILSKWTTATCFSFYEVTMVSDIVRGLSSGDYRQKTFLPIVAISIFKFT